MAPASDLRKLSLVIWKNAVLLGRNKLKLAWLVCWPFLIISATVLLRLVFESKKIPNRKYPPLAIDTDPHLGDFSVQQFGFTPKSYNLTMLLVDKALHMEQSMGFDTESELVDFIRSGEMGSRAGIVFRMEMETNVLQIALRFYSKESWIYSAWQDFRIGIRDRELAAGSYDKPGYYTRGFAHVQNAVFRALHEGINDSVLLNRMPVKASEEDPYRKWIFTYAAPVFISVFMVSISNAILIIVEEKQSSLKELMLIMGLPVYIKWIGYLSLFLIENIIIICVAVILWSVPINSVAIFEHSHTFLLWVFLLVFTISLSTLAMCISTLFHTTDQINIISVLLVTITSFPVTSSTDFRDFGPGLNTAVLLLSPSTFGIAMRTFIVFEDIGVGMQWEYLFVSPGGTSFTTCTLLIAMVVQSICYLLLALYLENVFPGPYGSARNWYFPIEGFFQRSDIPAPKGVKLKRKKNKTKPRCQEEPDDSSVPGLVISNLTKAFSNNLVAVKDLSLTLYENEITIVLGENGAGKSTLISMLAGMITPTSGSAVFKQRLNLNRDMQKIRNLIGLCPQQTVLIQNFTVRDHLLFFGMLKGLEKDEAWDEANNFMDRCGLLDEAENIPENLSLSQQRKLNLCMALVGGTGVVFLDEPTSGVDPASRREIWAILQRERKQRVILLSTHFMDEADLLGDRLAIMHRGEMKCTGSPFYLKNTFESSYNLTCSLMDPVQIDSLTNVIRSFLPDAKLRHLYGSEVTYELKAKKIASFVELFKRLETVTTSIGLESFGIELPSLEDVFLKVTKDKKGQNAMVTLEAANYRILKGPALVRNRFWGLAMKRYYYLLQNQFITLVQLILPILGYVYFYYTHTSYAVEKDQLDLSLDIYDQGRRLCLIESHSNASDELTQSYVQLLTPLCNVTFVPDINRFIFALDYFENYHFLRTSMIGAKFTKDGITAFFSNEPLHTIPIALTAVFNALIQNFDPKAPQILFVNHPVPVRDPSGIMTPAVLYKILLPSVVLTLWTMTFGFLYLKEREVGAMNFQFINGLPPVLFWVGNFLCDCMVVIVSGSIYVGIVALIETISCPGMALLLILLYALAVLPFVYLMARVARQIVIFVFVMVTSGALGFALLYLLISGRLPGALEVLFMVLPSFNLFSLLYKQELDIREDLWKNYLMFFLSGAFWFTVLVLSDSQLLFWMSTWINLRSTPPLGQMDEDVLEEMQRVDAMDQETISQKALVVKHLRKNYGGKVIVKDATFTVEGGECLGLLGKSGSGKTTIFRMLTGEERITEGHAWIGGISVRKDPSRIYRHFGYCPQFDELLNDLTGLQWLEIIGLIRGVRAGDIPVVSRSLVLDLGFEEQVEKRVSTMSGGNKRKVSTALALIGDPSVLYLDDPTRGMDPGAKRRVWDLLTRYRNQGKAILMTSHSMDECEALCTRMVIMNEGKMEAIASSYRLKQKYSKVGHLVILFEREYRDQGTSNLLKIVLEDRIKGFFVKEEYQGKIECEFNAQEKLSKLYGLMQSLKEDHHIASYAISNQSSLANIFLDRVAGIRTARELQETGE